MVEQFFRGNHNDLSLSGGGMGSLVSRLLWAPSSGMVPLVGRYGGFSIRDIRLTGRLVEIRGKDLFVSCGVLGSYRSSAEHWVRLLILVLGIPQLIRQNQGPGVSDIECQVLQISNDGHRCVRNPWIWGSSSWASQVSPISPLSFDSVSLNWIYGN